MDIFVNSRQSGLVDTLRNIDLLWTALSTLRLYAVTNRNRQTREDIAKYWPFTLSPLKMAYQSSDILL